MRGALAVVWAFARRAAWGIATAAVDTIEDHVSRSRAAPGHLLEPEHEPPHHRARQSAREAEASVRLDSIFPGRNGGGD